MTDQQTDRDQLRALASAATPGPWEADYSGENNYSIKSPGTEWGDGYAWVSDPSNAEFIAAARTAIPVLLDQLEQAERDRDWLFRSSRLAKEGRIKANARAGQAEARIESLEDTARVLVRDVITAEDARDEHRRGKVAAEERIAEEKHLRMKATAAATKAEERIKSVEDVLDTWMTYCQTEQTARALSDIRHALEG